MDEKWQSTLVIFLPRLPVWANIPNMYVTMKLRFVEIHFTYNTDYVWEIFLRYLQVHNGVISNLMSLEDTELTLEVLHGLLWEHYGLTLKVS